MKSTLVFSRLVKKIVPCVVEMWGICIGFEKAAKSKQFWLSEAEIEEVFMS